MPLFQVQAFVCAYKLHQDDYKYEKHSITSLFKLQLYNKTHQKQHLSSTEFGDHTEIAGL